jgi:hypothetical protein
MQSANPSRIYVWVNPTVATGFVVALMRASILCSLFSLVLIFPGLLITHGVFPTQMVEHLWAGRDLGLYKSLWFAGSFLKFVVLVAGIGLITWVHRMSVNAHVLRGRPLANSPEFAAGWWYLIPVMFLYKPREAMGEIWEVSAGERRLNRQERALLNLWWGLFLAAYTSRAYVSATHFALDWVCLDELLRIGLALTVEQMARRLCQLQINRRQMGGFEDHAEAPSTVLQPSAV